jgi:hypothetical protein
MIGRELVLRLKGGQTHCLTPYSALSESLGTFVRYAIESLQMPRPNSKEKQERKTK